MPSNKITKLNKKQSQLAAKMQQQTTRIEQKKKAILTRQQIIIGRLCLEQTDNDFQADLTRFLDENLTKQSERKLFDLPDKKNQAPRIAASHWKLVA